MSKPASTASLNELHAKLAQQMTKTLERDLEDDMPTDAATMSVISNFLAKNNITCDPADKDTTSALAEKFKQQADIREARKRKSLEAVKSRGEDYNTGT